MKSKKMMACAFAALWTLALPVWATTEFEIEEGRLYGYSGDEPGGVVKIPEGVREIADEVFSGCEGITSVALPGTLRRIGENAFADCVNLKTVTGGANLEQVGYGAFRETRFVCGDQYFDGFASDAEEQAYWNGLEIVYVGNFAVGCRGELAAAWEDSSWDGDSLVWRHTLKFKAGTVGIADYLCGGLPFTSMEMPDSVKYIGKGAFSGTECLQQLKLGNGVVSIGEDAFSGSGCYWAEKYRETCGGWQDAINRVDRNATDCIVSLELPDSLERIGIQAFADCGFLCHVSGLRREVQLAGELFAGTPYAEFCANQGGDWGLLIEEGMVYGLDHFEELKFDEPWVDDEGELVIPDGKLVIPEGVWGIADGAFEYRAGFSTVSLPDSLHCIERDAFLGCDELKVVTGGANLEQVGGYAFDETRFVCGDQYFDGFASDAEEQAYWNGLEVVYVGNFAVGRRGELAVAWEDSSWVDDKLVFGYDLKLKPGTVGIADYLFCELPITSFTMPDSLKYIGKTAFGCCQYLRQLKLGKGLVSIGCRAFEEVGASLNDEYWDRYPINCENEWGSVVSRPDPNDPNCIVSLDLPSTVAYIGEEAFYGCGFLYYVNGLRNDIELEEGAFAGTPFACLHECTEGGQHMQFIVEDGVLVGTRESWDWWFEDAWVQDGVLTIPEGVVEIAPGALRDGGMQYVAKVILPSSLKKIGSEAFQWDSNLRYVEGLGANVVVGENAFEGTAYLDGWEAPALVIEDGVLRGYEWKWGHDDGCFAGGKLVVPEGVREIDSGAFADCVDITSITFPNSLKRIGDNAFEGCIDLKTVTGGANLEQVGYVAFRNTRFLCGDKYIDGFDSEEEREAYWNGLEVVYLGKFIVGVRGGLENAWSDQYYDADGNWTWTYELEIPEGTTGMAEEVFDAPPITSLKIPGSVRRIPDLAFEACPIRTLKLGDGIEEIGESAFEYTELSSVEIPESVQFVGALAFANNQQNDASLSVTIHSPETLFDSSAFTELGRIDLIMDGYHLVNWDVSLHDDDTMPYDGCLPAELEGQTADPAKCGLYPADGQAAFGTTYDAFYAWEYGTNTWTWTYLLTPVVEANRYFVEFNANGGKGAMLPVALTYDQLQSLPGCKFTRAGYDFLGWALSPSGEIAFLDEESVENLAVAGTVKLYAMWKRSTLWEPVIGPGGRQGAALEALDASAFNAYVYDEEGGTLGLLDIKAAKAKGKRGQELKTSAVSIAVQLLGQKKETVKGTMVVAGGDEGERGVFRGKTKSGEVVVLNFGTNGVSGRIGRHSVDGALNKFTAKDAASKALAAKVLSKRKDVYSVAFETADGWNGLSVVVGAKGKTKVTGTLADGSKVSTTAQLMIGDDDVCSLAVVYSKKNVNLAFNLWLLDDEIAVSGLENAIAGRPGTLVAGATFRVDAAQLSKLVGGSTYADYFPDGVAVAFNGKKFVVADGAKAGKVVLNKEKTGVDEAKAGANPSALKLAYTAKTGAFKGTFKGYTDVNGKPKAVSVTVTGVLLDGVGYGSALVKKTGAVPVEIR